MIPDKYVFSLNQILIFLFFILENCITRLLEISIKTSWPKWEKHFIMYGFIVGWHELFCPIMRGMGEELKFLLFVCACTPSMRIPETGKNGFLRESKTFGTTGFRVSRFRSVWRTDEFWQHFSRFAFAVNFGTGARSRGMERAVPGSCYSPRLFKQGKIFFSPSEKWGMVKALLDFF